MVPKPISEETLKADCGAIINQFCSKWVNRSVINGATIFLIIPAKWLSWGILLFNAITKFFKNLSEINSHEPLEILLDLFLSVTFSNDQIFYREQRSKVLKETLLLLFLLLIFFLAWNKNCAREQKICFCGTLWYWIAVFALYGLMDLCGLVWSW